jgi:hypothetical protein
MHPVAPPSALTTSRSGPDVIVQWTASPDTSLRGYQVYRSTNATNGYVRLNEALVTGTNCTDSSVPDVAHSFYMVRAVKLETSASGTYLNPSQGVFSVPWITYTQWQQTHFDSTQLANDPISGELACPAGDGMCNLLKYAFRLEPMTASATGWPVSGTWMDPDTQLRYLTLTYRQNLDAGDLAFMPQASSDLKAGEWSGGLPVVTSVKNADWVSVTVRDTQPMSNASQRFLRLKVTRQ